MEQRARHWHGRPLGEWATLFALTAAFLVAATANGQHAAAQEPTWPDEQALIDESDAAVRAAFIVDPGEGDRLTRADLLARQTYFTEDISGSVSGSFDMNFLTWAEIGPDEPGPTDRWTQCLQPPTQRDPGEPCPVDYVSFLDLRDSVEKGSLQMLHHDGAFIALACGNFSASGGAGPIPTISGVKYEDLDANGRRDPGEPVLQGWTIDLVYQGEVIETDQTDAEGRYHFELDAERLTGPDGQPIREGTYEVRERRAPGWVASETPEPITVEPAPAPLNHEANFGNYRPAEIRGRKFEDMDADGPDDDDPGVSAWGIDAEGPEAVSATTTDDGSYALAGLEPGEYRVTEETRDGWVSSWPTSGSRTVTVHSGDVVTGIDFGNYRPAEIRGRKYHDIDVTGNGDGDDGIADWRIRLDGQSTLTDAEGRYTFEGLSPGTYQVEEESRDGWRQTGPLPTGVHTMTARSGDVITNRDFGNVCLADLDVVVSDTSTGEPLDNVDVRLEEIDVPGVLDNDPGLPRESDGSFSGLLPGQYRVVTFVPDEIGTTDPDVTLVDGRFAVVKEVALDACEAPRLDVEMVSGSTGKVTGGLWMDVPGGRANSGFVFMARHGQPKGVLQYHDHPLDLNLHTKAIDVITVSDDHAWIWGRVKDDTGTEQRFLLHVVDAGEPGRNDVFELSVTPDYTAGFDQTVDGGNVQIHRGSDCVDLNRTDDTDKLQQLVHVGPRQATDIIEQRPYGTLDDLERIHQIDSEDVDEIRAQGLAAIEC